MATDDQLPQPPEPSNPAPDAPAGGVRAGGRARALRSRSDGGGRVHFRPGLRRRRWPRRVLWGTNLFVAFCIVAVVATFGYVEFRFGQINMTHVDGLRGDGTTPSNAPFTLLVIGSDTRDLTGSDNAQFGTESEASGQRSDTIILVRVVPATRQLSILSIPRDLYVPVPGLGTTRINAAFNNGPNLLVQTLSSALDIPVDHVVEVNFDTFRQITDAVGGVKFWFPTPAKDDYSLLSVPQAGCVNLTGDQALAFVRSRHYQYFLDGTWHSEAESDLARIQRQQAFIKKMIKKAEGEVTNPIALNGIIGGLTKNLTVDQGFTKSFMVGLARQLHGVDAAAIPSQTVPTFSEVIGGADVLGLQQPQAQQMIAAFNNLGGPTPTAGAGAGASGGAGTGGGAVDPASVSVQVANGSGVEGQAAQAAADLRSLGYNATVSTAPGSGFTTNVIRYAPDSQAAAEQLQGQLAGGATLTEDGSLTSSPYNLELITGSSWGGLAGSTSALVRPAAGRGAAAGGGSAGGSAAVLTADSTSTATPPVTQYVLPGAPPGAQPPADCN